MSRAEYVRKMNRSYLVLQPEDEGLFRGYQMKMLCENKIEGLLPAQVKEIDGNMKIYYDITSCESLKERYAFQDMYYGEVKSLLLQLAKCQKGMRYFLLEDQYIQLDEKNIFWDMERKSFSFVYFPERTGLEKSGYRSLAEFILEKVNHKDDLAVKLAYRFYKETRCQQFALQSMVKLIEEMETTGLEKKASASERDIYSSKEADRKTRDVQPSIYIDYEEGKMEHQTKEPASSGFIQTSAVNESKKRCTENDELWSDEALFPTDSADTCPEKDKKALLLSKKNEKNVSRGRKNTEHENEKTKSNNKSKIKQQEKEIKRKKSMCVISYGLAMMCIIYAFYEPHTMKEMYLCFGIAATLVILGIYSMVTASGKQKKDSKISSETNGKQMLGIEEDYDSKMPTTDASPYVYEMKKYEPVQNNYRKNQTVLLTQTSYDEFMRESQNAIG